MEKLITLSICCCFLLAAAAQNEVYVLEQRQDEYALLDELYILEDSTEQLTIADLTKGPQPAGFRTYQDWAEKLSPNTTYWGSIALENRLPDADNHAEWVLEFSRVLSQVTVYAVYPDGRYTTSRTGIFQPYFTKTFRPAADPNLVKVILPPQTPVRLYFQVRSDRPSIAPQLDIALRSSTNYFQARSKKKWLNGIFLGFVLMMLIYNLVLLLYFKDPAYVYYSLYLVAIAVYSAYVTGDLGDWLTPMLFYPYPPYLFLIKFIIYAGLIFYLTFIRRFLDLHRLMPRWDQIFRWLIILGIPAMILDISLLVGFNYSYWYSDQVSILYVGAFTVATLVFLVALYKTPADNKKIFIIAGVAAMSIGFLLTIIERIQLHSFTLIPFRIGTTLEIIAFSLGLAYRQRQNEREKQRALFQQEQEHAEAIRLKELHEMKTRFYNNITHEFRTPLTIIQGMAEQIKGHQQARELISRNSKNLLRLINQMLDLAKVDSGKLELQLIQANIIDYLQYLTESFRSFATSRNLRLNFFSAKAQLLMDYDETKIQQIMYNLLSNAIKFTPAGGKVTVHLDTDETHSQLLICVKDTGIGIAKAQQERIFDHFYQVPDLPSGKNESDEITSPHAGGTGIGLALTRELVKLMGGSIHLQSEIGQGAEFIVQLPIRQNAPHAYTPAYPQDVSPPLAPAGEPDATIHDPTAPEGAPLLLIIEDNLDIITYIKTCLQEEYLIQVAMNGKEGVDTAFESIPDIIISDVMMPEKDGFAVCRELKSDERTSHIPIILLTALSEEEAMLEGLREGADAYLTKPFHKGELLLRLDNLIELGKRIQARYSREAGRTGLSADGEAAANEPSLDDLFLAKLRDSVLERLNEPELAIPYLCKAIGLSHTQLYRKLKAITRQTPSQFIRSVRLAKAREMLETTGLNIAEIAYDVGFTDPNYFSRTFQQVYGEPPSAIRK